MTRELIEDFTKIVKPFVQKRLLEENFEGMGEQDKTEFGRDFDEILSLAIKGLESSTWIPVTERLPEEREWYLAVFKEINTGYELIPRVADYIGKGKNEWRIIDEDGLGQEYRSILECVAWMPLPEPYEEDKMADAKKCDRCGKYYEENQDYPIQGKTLWNYRISSNKSGRYLDLCINCKSDLERFMKCKEATEYLEDENYPNVD